MRSWRNSKGSKVQVSGFWVPGSALKVVFLVELAAGAKDQYALQKLTVLICHEPWSPSAPPKAVKPLNREPLNGFYKPFQQVESCEFSVGWAVPTDNR
jgi:hypothetical protein